jgi:hypothetical protein
VIKYLLPALVAAPLALTGFASPALADQRADLLAACLAASGDNTEFCTCKADETVKIVDAAMIDFIILNMKDPAKFREEIAAGKVPQDVQDKWPHYVMDTNKICLPEDIQG